MGMNAEELERRLVAMQQEIAQLRQRVDQLEEDERSRAASEEADRYAEGRGGIG